MSIEFLLTTLLIVVSPGVGVIYTLAAGLAHGGSVSFAAAFGLLAARLALTER
jgi:threonine/homoserine/homoserine lactone efflux protein